MKKILTLILSVLLALGCAAFFVACGEDAGNTGNNGNTPTDDDGGTTPGGATDDGDDNNGDDNDEGEDDSTVTTTAAQGFYTYKSEDGETTDEHGWSWTVVVKDDLKFTFTGTYEDEDGNVSVLSNSGQIEAVNNFRCQCFRVAIGDSYSYNGETNEDWLAEVKAMSVEYREAWTFDYGQSQFFITLVRETNDTSQDGYAGTFYVNDGYDLTEGVWEYTPVAAE